MFKSTMLLLMYSGGSRGAPPLFLEHTEVQRAEKNFLETAPPPPLISRSGSGTHVVCEHQ